MPTYYQAIVLYRNDKTLTQNPATIGNTVTINNTSGYYFGDGVFGTQDAYWDLTSNGTIIGPGNAGVYFEIGGNVTNNGGASISGGLDGIYLGDRPPGLPFATYHNYGRGNITNLGSIKGTGRNGVYLTTGGQVNNNGPAARIGGGLNGVYATGNSGGVVNTGVISGANGSGVFLNAGGVVTNIAGTIFGGDDGVLIKNGFGQVTNSASIGGNSFDGVVFNTGGILTNEIGATIADGLDGVYVAGGAGTITNGGTITGMDGSGVHLVAGGIVSNSSNGYVSGADDGVLFEKQIGTVVNGGTIAGFYSIHLGAGGVVTNTTAGVVSGYRAGIDVAVSPGTVLNGGAIVATSTATNSFGNGVAGVALSDGGLVSNSSTGMISGGDYGVSITGGSASVVNSGTITGNGFADVFFLALGTVNNYGTIAGNGFLGIDLVFGGNVTNASGGVVSGFNAIFTTGAATVVNAGMLTGFTPVGFDADNSTVYNYKTGLISGSADGIDFNGTAGMLTNFGTVVGAGGDGVSLTSGGSILNEAGALITGSKVGVALSAGATVDNFGTIGGAETAVSFGGPGEKLVVEAGAVFGGAINGFSSGDTIDFAAITYTPGLTAAITGGTLTLSDGGTTLAQLAMTGIADGLLPVSPDSVSGTDVTVACYCRGTRILTDRGELPVEALGLGTRLVTRDGSAKPVKWIGRRSYVGWLAAGNPKVLPVCFKPGALADGVPRRELWVSPEHAMYLDGVLVPAELLVNGTSIVKAASVDEVHYFHLELEEHDVILAEGAWAESFVDDDSRGMFHNAAEYGALYPEAPMHAPARYCAPRVEDGFELEAFRRRLGGRARRLRPDGTAAAAAALEGHLDLVRHDRIAGWARDPERPQTPVALVVLANGAEIGRVAANRYRPDLAAAGIGDGCHAFELVVPGGLAADWRHTIELCRVDDSTPLPGSPAVLEPPALLSLRRV